MNPQIKILSLDPSGTGTTGICLVERKPNNQEFTFLDFKSKDWQEHLKFIVNLLKEQKPNFIIFENTNYIYGRQHQGTTNLYKLIGAIIGLEYTFDFVQQIEGVFVNRVKGLRKKLQTGIFEIPELTCKIGRGKGWKYQEQRLNLHKLDAFLIYQLWAKENLPTKDKLEVEINNLKAKGKRMGRKQKARLKKLESIWRLNYGEWEKGINVAFA